MVTPVKPARLGPLARTLAAGVIVGGLATGTVIESLRRPTTLPARCPECAACPAPEMPPLVEEDFDDGALGPGWYDNRGLVVVNGAAEFRFAAGSSTPASGSGTRIQFEPQTGVRISYRVKYSPGWVGSGQPFHPHELYLLTNLDGRYAGLARSHLTVYVEQNAGRPVMLLQDSLNIGQGAVAGCDVLPGDCYTSGGNRMNGRAWAAQVAPLTPGGWHTVEATVRLNTPGQPDGELSLTVDGTRVLHVTDAVMRSVTNASMQLNQLVIGPYMSRSPVEQTMWVDDVAVRAAD